MNFLKEGKLLTLMLVMSFSLTSIFLSEEVFSADHVEAPLAIDNPELDITDVFTFLDPQDESQIVAAMAVNPFLPPEDNVQCYRIFSRCPLPA